MITAITPSKGDILSGNKFYNNVIVSQCRVCREAIGFDSEFCLDPETVGAYVHKNCMTKLIEGDTDNG